MKKIDNDELQEKLDFLKLDLEKIPKFIKEATTPSFSTNRVLNDKELKVYKFVPINQIEILFTPCLRSDELKKKYSECLPLKNFLNSDGDEEEVMYYKTFSKIIRNISVDEVKKIEEIQDNFQRNIPFKIKYKRDHLWQIYYSEKSDKYFMLVCMKENTFSEFAYLLKSQIEFAKSRKKSAPMIYVPINCVGYSEKFFKKSEITDIENYLWLFTKNWPLIFEAYDRDNNCTLNIVGETFVYENIKSNYKVVLNDSEEAVKFYKLMKALFIMQTEIKGQYNFKTSIDTNNSLKMHLAKVEITFDSITNFIKNEFLLADYEIENQNKEIIVNEKKLAKLKKKIKEKEDEYLQKQKEISTYLECKKTFLGKMKYFFKSDKKSKSKNSNRTVDDISESESPEISTNPLSLTIEKKEFYTIEDLVVVYSIFEKGNKKIKELTQDIKALKLKMENLTSKVRNANQYIEEIDKHKKSIFEFWKFANKDEKLSLEEGDKEETNKEKNELKKSFDYEKDFEGLGERVDREQRKKLSGEEIDSIFIAQTEILPLINMVAANEIEKKDFEDTLKNLKKEFNEDRLIVANESFDIFGNVEENTNKVKYIGSRSHREVEKNKFKIMNVNKKIDIFDFTEKVQSIKTYLEGALPKITSEYEMKLYKLKNITENISNDRFELFNINVEKELEECEDKDYSAYNLICINYKEDFPLVYYTNSIFYDNNNKTLPVGMNLSTKVLIDNSKFAYELVNKTKFRTNAYFNDENEEFRVREIFLYEYDLKLVNNNEERDEKNLKEYFERVESDMISKKPMFEDENETDDSEEFSDKLNDKIEKIMEDAEKEELKYNKTEENDENDEIDEKKSKKMLKMEQKFEKERQKLERKEQKAREKMKKK